MTGKLWTAGAAGVAAGALAVASLRPDARSVDPMRDGASAARIDAVRQIAALEREVAELKGRVAEESRLRARLADEVAGLQDRLARAEGGGAVARDDRLAAARSTDGGAVAAIDPAGTGNETLDVAVLVTAGFDRVAVEDYRRRQDELELERLYLRDRAAREGWLGTDRFRQEVEAISAERRRMDEDYGPAFQDWLLYASGRPNRVGVTEVMAGSPAELAGLAPGDLVLSYGGGRIHHPGELRRATRGGVAGESVEVEVLRDGRTVVLDVPRGPLGVRMEPLRHEPPAPG